MATITSILVAGRGRTEIARLRDHASDVDRRRDHDLIALAAERGLFSALHAAGVATIDGEITGDGWLLYASKIPESDLDADPAVLRYCTVSESEVAS